MSGDLAPGGNVPITSFTEAHTDFLQFEEIFMRQFNRPGTYRFHSSLYPPGYRGDLCGG